MACQRGIWARHNRFLNVTYWLIHFDDFNMIQVSAMCVFVLVCVCVCLCWCVFVLVCVCVLIMITLSAIIQFHVCLPYYFCYLSYLVNVGVDWPIPYIQCTYHWINILERRIIYISTTIEWGSRSTSNNESTIKTGVLHYIIVSNYYLVSKCSPGH